MYKYAVAGKCGKYDLVAVNSSALLIYVVVTRLLDPEYFQSYRKNPMDNMRKLFVSGVVLRVSAPVLQTLTSSFSENTVHSLILITSTFHLITFDYNFRGEDEYAGNLWATISLNAAVFIAVLLASRLTDIDMVVSFVIFAAITFAVLPGLGRLIRQRSTHYHMFSTILLWVAATLLLIRLNLTLLVAYEVMIVFLWLLCPWWYLLLTSYKKALRGPWEEAIVTVPHSGS
jgi:hypothetical protein